MERKEFLRLLAQETQLSVETLDVATKAMEASFGKHEPDLPALKASKPRVFDWNPFTRFRAAAQLRPAAYAAPSRKKKR